MLKDVRIQPYRNLNDFIENYLLKDENKSNCLNKYKKLVIAIVEFSMVILIIIYFAGTEHISFSCIHCHNKVRKYDYLV